jgi:hypothetical protein
MAGTLCLNNRKALKKISTEERDEKKEDIRFNLKGIFPRGRNAKKCPAML